MTNCKNCGAPLVNGHCEYCGASYNHDIFTPYVLHVENPKVDVIGVGAEVDYETIFALGAEEASKIAMEKLIEKMAEATTPYVNIETVFDPAHLTQAYIARLRVVRPGVRI